MPALRSQWWSQPAYRTLTNVDPASTSRRASRVLCPQVCRPYSSRSRGSSLLMSKARRAAGPLTNSNASRSNLFIVCASGSRSRTRRAESKCCVSDRRSSSRPTLSPWAKFRFGTVKEGVLGSLFVWKGLWWAPSMWPPQ
jgi:hypothetical protein